jgi:hypothetical protein
MSGTTGVGPSSTGPALANEFGGTTMSDMQVQLTIQERNLLIRILNRELGDTRVELHRTHFSPEFRGEVKEEEAMLRQLLGKLKRVDAATPQ